MLAAHHMNFLKCSLLAKHIWSLLVFAKINALLACSQVLAKTIRYPSISFLPDSARPAPAFSIVFTDREPGTTAKQARVNPDIFASYDVKSVSSLSPNNKPIWRLTWKHALRRMLWRHFSSEEPWVLEWIRIPSDKCGRAIFDMNTLHVDGKIFESGKKKLRIQTYPNTCRLNQWRDYVMFSRAEP